MSIVLIKYEFLNKGGKESSVQKFLKLPSLRVED